MSEVSSSHFMARAAQVLARSFRIIVCTCSNGVDVIRIKEPLNLAPCRR